MNQEVPKNLEPVFILIDKAGGPKLPNIKDLTFTERLKVIFNIWAFLFGILYYLYKKMWKRGIVYFALTLAISFAGVLLLDISEDFESIFTQLVGMVIFGTRANIDLYKYYKLNDHNWI